MNKNILLALLTFLTVFAGRANAQTNVTDRIVNPSFEDDWTGWNYDGLARQGNNSFPLKEGNTYVEKWTGEGGRVGNASLHQTVTGLEAGIYTVGCVAQNIQQGAPQAKQTGVTLQANGQTAPVNVAGEYSVQTLVTDGTLQIGFVLQNATGNYVCVDNFRLTQDPMTADGYADLHQQMQAIVDEAKAIDQHTGTEEQTRLDAARQAMEVLIVKDVTEGVAEAVLRLQAAIFDYRLSVATANNTVDMTSCIVNPSFEVKGTNGWNNSGMAPQGNDAFSLKQGNVYLEAWTGSGGRIHDCTVSQTVPLPNGRYRITAAAQNIQQANEASIQTGAWIFCNESEKKVDSKRTYRVEAVVIDGEATIGFKTRNATGNWVACDNFTATYLGRSDEMLLEALAERIAEAETLVEAHKNSSVQQSLSEAITAAKALTTSKEMTPVAVALRNAMEAANSSIAAYTALAEAIAQSELNYGEGTGNEAPAYRAAIDNALQAYDDLSLTDQALAEAVSLLATADLVYNLANATGDIPEVHTHDFVARGATGALGRSTVSGSNIKEKGFCWATHPEPTILDNRTTFNYNINGPMYLMQPLEPATIYYVRAYAITKGYQVGYGEVRKVITTPMGTNSWWYNYGADADANARIAAALEDCIYYYNNWSGIQGFHISCTFGSGTPTADCGYGGGMRVGPNPAYQRTGTILHESNHGVGIGTSGRWWDGNLHDGVWKGRRANKVLQFIDNNPKATMAGDGMHMWPYGINGANEDNGWAMTYIANVLITYAMHEDGLVPPGKAGNTPAYSFPCEEGVKYYMQSEKSLGAYLYDAGTELKWENADKEAVQNDDAYAWYAEFSPTKLYYRLRNAKTGRYLSYAGGKIKPSTKETPTDTEFFQLMAGRNDITYTTPTGGFSTCAYWMMAGKDELAPATLTLGANGSTTCSNFNLSDAATQQRWIFLKASELEEMDKAVIEAEKEKLRALVESAKKMSGVPHNDIQEDATTQFVSEINVAEGLISTSADKSAIQTEYTVLLAAIKDFITTTAVTGEELYNITFMLANAAFEGTDGWTCNPTPAQNEGISEYYQTTYEVKQTLPDMPAGRYEFRVQGFERPGSYTTAYNDWSNGTNKVKAFLYYRTTTNKTLMKHIMDDAQTKSLGNNEQTVGGKYQIPDGMSSANRFFAKGLYDNAHVFEHEKQGNMLVGIKNTQNVGGDWTAFDNFRLYCYGNPTSGNDIRNVTAEEEVSPASCYDLSGRRILTVPRRGIYIRNGKKILVK